MIFSRFLIPLARSVIPVAVKPQQCLFPIPLRNYTAFTSKRFFSTEANGDQKATKMEATEDGKKPEEKQEEELKVQDPRDAELKVRLLQSQIETKRRVKKGKQKGQRLEN